jgi:hypothetical protein
MKLPKNYLFVFLFFLSNLLYSQKVDKNFYFKDTIFEFSGLKVEVKKSIADNKMFKGAMIITNNTDQFVIINPGSIIGSELNSQVKTIATISKKIVIPPKYTKGFTFKFLNIDFRKAELEINVETIQFTDKVEFVYDISDFDFYSQITKSVGPLKWTTLKIYQDENDTKDYFKIDGSIEYSGSNFLAIYYNNAFIKTKDGQTFINAGPSKSVLQPNKNKFYFDNSKEAQKLILIFPVESRKITREIEPKLNFIEVFKEYSLKTIPGFKIKLKQGSFDDYRQNDKKNDDNGIENME